jgi:hypothetical protein
MGARITRPSSGDGAPTLKRSEKILFKVSRGASSIYSTLLSLLRRDAPSPELYRQNQWVRISGDVSDAPKGFALVVDTATTADDTIRVRIAGARRFRSPHSSHCLLARAGCGSRTTRKTIS